MPGVLSERNIPQQASFRLLSGQGEIILIASLFYRAGRTR